MPTISPIARAVIGASSEEMFRQPRGSVKASTGMNLPPIKETAPGAPGSLPSPKIGQSDTTEETAPEAVTLSPQLTALARKQQRLQQEVQAQRDKEAAWSAKEADYIPKTAFKEKAEANVAEALKDLGLDYEQLTNLLLSQQQSDDPVKKLEAKIQKIETDHEQQVSKQYEATVSQYKKEIASLIDSDEAYITVKEEKAQDAVLQHILDTFHNDGEILSVEAASAEIEDFLVEEALKKAQLTKVKSRLSPPAEKAPEKTLPPPKTAPRTLTERVTTAPTRTVGQFQHLSPQERLAQAIARAQK